ncbi:MAG: phosphoenolpyruvate--protein phosphotransferase, partial [Desulfohalobiaceae bacterium]
MAKKILTGIPVSVGIGIGKAYYLRRGGFHLAPRQIIAQGEIEPEVKRLTTAFDLASKELEDIQAKVPLELREHAAVLETHIMLLRDKKLRATATGYVRDQRLNAEWALEKAVADIEKAFRQIQDEYIRERILDIRQVVKRVLNAMAGSVEEIEPIDSRVILVARDLTPADTIELDVNKIMAFATATGGKTSHVGILARSLQTPAVVGVAGLEPGIIDNELIIIDAMKGRILIDPDEEELAHYSDLKYQFENYRATIIRRCNLPGETIDGYRVNVLANIELFEEVTTVLDNGGEGIGLYRSEYSYMNRRELPGEEELMEEYRDLAHIVHPRKVVIRTLDVGGDKFDRIFGPSEEANPALGLRAIRFCMRHPEMFKTQLRAILRASVVGNLSIMFPMVSGLHELRDLKRILFQVREDLKRDGLAFNPDMPVGIMVELPSAVMTADILAPEVDFFSIGTNDLIQYSLGIDRTNRHVSYLDQPLHPALLRSIKHVVDAGHQSGIEVSICGEMASDPYCVPILMGMKIDNLSLNPQAIPGIKRIIRRTTMQECFTLLKQVLESNSVPRNNRLVRNTIFKRFPE